MNNEKLEQILRSIGGQNVPADIARIAEQTTESFIAALRFIHAQQSVQAPFIVGLKRIAVAAVILFAFAVGLMFGRLSKPLSPSVVFTEPALVTPALSTADDSTHNFWRQKVVALLQSEARRGIQSSRQPRNLLDIYNQYVKEKHYD